MNTETPRMNPVLHRDKVPLLTAEEIRSGYGKTEILHGVSCAVFPGEVFSVIGPNGAGKSTLLNLLAGLAPLSTGKREKGEGIIFKDRPLGAWNKRELARLRAWVPQKGAYAWSFTVAEAVLQGRYAYSPSGFYSAHDKSKADAAMKQMDLLPLKDRYVSELSGGEFQRVLVARALAQEPELLILDEPVTGLDIRYQYELLSCLKNLSRQGLAVVLSIHDLNLASLFSDRILLLKNGAVRGCGTPEAVLDPALLSEVYGISLERFSHPGTGRPQFTCGFS